MTRLCKSFYVAVTALAACIMPVFAQQAAWTVKPEWVRAHEEFLASDVMAGRGSATRDEEIAATYVASRFISYGLKPAPGIAGYLQSAEIEKPTLDGKATLTLGATVLREDQDFTLLMSMAKDEAGSLKVVAAEKPVPQGELRGQVVVVKVPAGKVAMQELNNFRRSGAAMLIVPEDASTKGSWTMFGGKTMTPMGLKGEVRPGLITIVVIRASAQSKLAAAKDIETASLAVHVQPVTTPRRTFNAIGYLPGTDPASGTILLTAHLDHLGVGAPVDGDSIYNGANDDAAGTTAVLELAHALANGQKLKRGVLFVCYGSEEAGALGSTYFGEHPPVPLASLVTNLEFEMIGNQDPRMPKGVLLLTGWERSNLGPVLKEHGALLGPDPYPEQHFFERSDNYSLALKGVVAHTAAGWGTPPTYHKPNDDLAHLNFDFMTSAIQSLVEPVRWLAMSDFKPSWNNGGQPKGR